MYWKNKPKNFRKQISPRYIVDFLDVDEIVNHWNRLRHGMIA